MENINILKGRELKSHKISNANSKFCLHFCFKPYDHFCYTGRFWSNFFKCFGMKVPPSVIAYNARIGKPFYRIGIFVKESLFSAYQATEMPEGNPFGEWEIPSHITFKNQEGKYVKMPNYVLRSCLILKQHQMLEFNIRKVKTGKRFKSIYTLVLTEKVNDYKDDTKKWIKERLVGTGYIKDPLHYIS